MAVTRDDVKGQKICELFQAKASGGITSEAFQAQQADLNRTPHGKFILRAQRDGETQDGSKHLWFLWQSQQYVDVPKGHYQHAPRRYATKTAQKPDLPETDGTEMPSNNEMGIDEAF